MFLFLIVNFKILQNCTKSLTNLKHFSVGRDLGKNPLKHSYKIRNISVNIFCDIYYLKTYLKQK